MAAVASLAVASTAGAETQLSASAGAVFGGYLESAGKRRTYAAALTYFAHDRLGFEFEAARTREIFRREMDAHVTTFVGSILARGRVGDRWSGYAAAGLGGVRSELYNVSSRQQVHNWHPCFSFGLGAMAEFNRFGVRADLRHLSALEEGDAADPFDREFGDFSVWRGTAGLFVRF